MSPYHVKVAAEAYAAGMLAHANCDVSVQYGADQPYYDLIAAKQDRLLKISVKGSQDGSWVLRKHTCKKRIMLPQSTFGSHVTLSNSFSALFSSAAYHLADVQGHISQLPPRWLHICGQLAAGWATPFFTSPTLMLEAVQLDLPILFRRAGVSPSSA